MAYNNNRGWVQVSACAYEYPLDPVGDWYVRSLWELGEGYGWAVYGPLGPVLWEAGASYDTLEEALAAARKAMQPLALALQAWW